MMTLNDHECLIQLSVRMSRGLLADSADTSLASLLYSCKTDAGLTSCSARSVNEPRKACEADALSLCGSWASCLRHGNFWRFECGTVLKFRQNMEVATVLSILKSSYRTNTSNFIKMRIASFTRRTDLIRKRLLFVKNRASFASTYNVAGCSTFRLVYWHGNSIEYLWRIYSVSSAKNRHRCSAGRYLKFLPR